MDIKKHINISNLTIIVALALSTIAAYYSIIGLTAIFAGAVIPVIVMGSILEVGKITTTVWLRKYWDRVGLALKTYLVAAVVALALLTSMGIFGFLSRAHIDAGITSGDSQAKLALIDEKIKTERDNIELARKALQQMDAQVDARLSRGASEQGAERAVQIRRQQATERTKLQKEISDSQKRIASLNEERAPIAAENRKIEAEVGPIKYVAALIYGDNPDTNLLERAVRWVIILLVAVFDPLAIALVLAANNSKEWDKEENNIKLLEPPLPPSNTVTTTNEQREIVPIESMVAESSLIPESNSVVEANESIEPKNIELMDEVVSEIREQPAIEEVHETPIIKNKTEDKLKDTSINVTKEKPYKDLGNGYVSYEGKAVQVDALKQMRPELFINEDFRRSTNFGIQFPKTATKGDIFVRVDMLPNKVYKFDGKKWIEINKTQSDLYLNNTGYLKYLVNKIGNGEYDIELLTDIERIEIEKYLRENKAP